MPKTPVGYDGKRSTGGVQPAWLEVSALKCQASYKEFFLMKVNEFFEKMGSKIKFARKKKNHFTQEIL